MKSWVQCPALIWRKKIDGHGGTCSWGGCLSFRIKTSAVVSLAHFWSSTPRLQFALNCIFADGLAWTDMEMKWCIKTQAVRNSLGILRHPGSHLPTSRPSLNCHWGNPPKPFHIGRGRALETVLPTCTSAPGKFQRGSATVFHRALCAGCWVWHSGPASCSPSQGGGTTFTLTFSLPDSVHHSWRLLLWMPASSRVVYPMHSCASPFSPSTNGSHLWSGYNWT